MGKEIKINYGEVEKAISESLNAVELVKINPPSAVAGNSRLSSFDEMENLTKELLTVTSSYQTLLKDQLTKTRNLTDSLKETDQQLAVGISRGEKG